VWVEVEGCFHVKARSEEEIRDRIEEGSGRCPAAAQQADKLTRLAVLTLVPPRE
jgi:hypothetical protein